MFPPIAARRMACRIRLAMSPLNTLHPEHRPIYDSTRLQQEKSRLTTEAKQAAQLLLVNKHNNKAMKKERRIHEWLAHNAAVMQGQSVRRVKRGPVGKMGKPGKMVISPQRMTEMAEEADDELEESSEEEERDSDGSSTVRLVKKVESEHAENNNEEDDNDADDQDDDTETVRLVKRPEEEGMETTYDSDDVVTVINLRDKLAEGMQKMSISYVINHDGMKEEKEQKTDI